MRNSEFEIHPFDQGFYIESLLKKTHSILNDAKSLNNFWMKRNYHCKNDNMILDLFENIILNAGGISRFFWPSKNQGHYKIRAEKLREVYHINDSSVLKNRDMRNHIEHFDEKLDDFLKEFSTWKVMQKYVGPFIFVDDNRTFFRAYFMIRIFLRCLIQNMKWNQLQMKLEEFIRFYCNSNKIMVGFK